MTSSLSKFYTIFILILLCLVSLLIFTWEVEAKLCGKPNRTLSSPCIDSVCYAKCIDSDLDAVSGSCEGFFTSECFCYYEC
uniref:Defensin-like protein n=1 Tax=Medicago truncatula TaxID=3880 RepID=I3SJ70_MEDTR|nr:unknown [Medicago truncatula]